MKFDVDDKNRRRLVCVKFHLNRCRFAVAVVKCLGGSLFWDTVQKPVVQLTGRNVLNIHVHYYVTAYALLISSWFVPPYMRYDRLML